eukprot:1915-Heterococcus_DN1.PRE.1
MKFAPPTERHMATWPYSVNGDRWRNVMASLRQQGKVIYSRAGRGNDDSRASVVKVRDNSTRVM